MTTTGLPLDDIEEVRIRTRRWCDQNRVSYPEVARRSRVELSDLKKFMAGHHSPGPNETVAIHLVAYLPLDLVYEPAKILPA